MCHQKEFFLSEVHRQSLNSCWLFPSRPASCPCPWAPRLCWQPSDSNSCGLVATPNCRGQTQWEGKFSSSFPFPKHGHCCPPSTAEQAQLELGGLSSSDLSLFFSTSCGHGDDPSWSLALQNISWYFSGEQQSPTRKTPHSFFSCP